MSITEAEVRKLIYDQAESLRRASLARERSQTAMFSGGLFVLRRLIEILEKEGALPAGAAEATYRETWSGIDEPDRGKAFWHALFTLLHFMEKPHPDPANVVPFPR